MERGVGHNDLSFLIRNLLGGALVTMSMLESLLNGYFDLDNNNVVEIFCNADSPNANRPNAIMMVVVLALILMRLSIILLDMIVG